MEDYALDRTQREVGTHTRTYPEHRPLVVTRWHLVCDALGSTAPTASARVLTDLFVCMQHVHTQSSKRVCKHLSSLLAWKKGRARGLVEEGGSESDYQ